jgi:hypothetical protein
LYTLTEHQFSRKLLGKTHKNSQENPFIVSHFVAWTKEQEETDGTELIVCFRNFANAPKNGVRGNSLVPCWSSVPEGADNKQDKYQSY